MKQSVNFRLENNVISILELISRKLKMTKTEVVENAIKNYTHKTKASKNQLLKYSACVPTKLLDKICDEAYTTRNIINLSRDNPL